MTNILMFCLLFLHPLLSPTHGCSFTCDLSVERICLDNVWGLIAPDCSGFIDCVSLSKPCGGECRPEYPVMSEDGLSCDKCKEDGKTCPQCKEGELWCREEEACKQRTDTCGGKCPSLLYPMLNVTKQECSPFSRRDMPW